MEGGSFKTGCWFVIGGSSGILCGHYNGLFRENRLKHDEDLLESQGHVALFLPRSIMSLHSQHIATIAKVDPPVPSRELFGGRNNHLQAAGELFLEHPGFNPSACFQIGPAAAGALRLALRKSARGLRWAEGPRINMEPEKGGLGVPYFSAGV